MTDQDAPIDSQEDPDTGSDLPEPIVPRYMLRRIEAMRRYPVEDGDYPGVDRNAAARQAFIEGAEWEATEPQPNEGIAWEAPDAGHA